MTPAQNTKAGSDSTFIAPNDAQGWPAVARQEGGATCLVSTARRGGGSTSPARIPWHHGFAEAS